MTPPIRSWKIYMPNRARVNEVTTFAHQVLQSNRTLDGQVHDVPVKDLEVDSLSPF